MTPEERAVEIVEEKRRYWEPWLTLMGGCPPTRALVEEKLQAFIADAIRAAVAEERERCAKVVLADDGMCIGGHGLGGYDGPCPECIAAAIRGA